jgi:methionyl-tRNA synthetase
VEDWYRLVQAANEYISKAEPWKKYKEEATQQEALDDLSFLLWVIKQLGLVSAPLLIDGFAHLQNILGNAEIQAIDTSKNEKSDFKSIFDAKSYPVNLNPEIMYQRKEQA